MWILDSDIKFAESDSVWRKSGFSTDMLKSMYITAGFARAWLLSRAFPNRGSTFYRRISGWSDNGHYDSARLKNGMRVSHHHCPVVGQRRISSYVWCMHVRILPGSMTVCRPWFSPCSFFPCSLRDHISNGTRRSSLFRPKGQRHVGQRVGVEVEHLKYADFDLENVRLVCNFVTGRGSGQWQGGYRKFLFICSRFLIST